MKRILAVLLPALLWALPLSGCRAAAPSGGLTPVTLAEEAHSLFYAPQYAAMELGYFKDQGIDLTLLDSHSSEQAMADLASGKAQIGLMGPEASIYSYLDGAADPAVCFAQLTQRAGDFLVSRAPEPGFSWDSLKGSAILGGKPGSMPRMAFEYILKKHGIDPEKDLTLLSGDTSGPSAALSESGVRYALDDGPFAASLNASEWGNIAAYLGAESGYIPYTAYCAPKSFLEGEPETAQGVVNAIQQGLKYVRSHTPEEIARTIAPQFKELPQERIAAAIQLCKEQDAWKEDTVFEESSFRLLENLMEEAGTLKERVPYEALVTDRFSREAL